MPNYVQISSTKKKKKKNYIQISIKGIEISNRICQNYIIEAVCPLANPCDKKAYKLDCVIRGRGLDQGMNSSFQFLILIRNPFPQFLFLIMLRGPMLFPFLSLFLSFLSEIKKNLMLYAMVRSLVQHDGTKFILFWNG